MKFITLLEHIKSALEISEKALGKSTNLPILGHFLIETDTNRIKVLATNLELAILTTFPGKVEEAGKITIPAKTLLDFLSQISEDKIEAVSEGKKLKIKTTHHHTTFQGLDPEEFPIVPKIKETQGIKMLSSALKTGFLQVILAASTSEIRPELVSVLLTYEPGKDLKFVATDSFRLAEKTIYENQFSTMLKSKVYALIPAKTASEVIKIAQEKPGDVEIFIDPNQVEFRWEDTKLISRLLEGEFPEYSSVIPKEFVAEAIVDRKRITEAIRASGVFASKLNDVRIVVDPQKNIIALRAADAARGENETFVEAKITGNPADITFNYRYLLDGLESIEEKNIRFGFNDVASPTLISPENDRSYFYIVMPIRL